jgi:hypothetical protein
MNIIEKFPIDNHTMKRGYPDETYLLLLQVALVKSKYCSVEVAPCISSIMRLCPPD